jgi:Caspase domain
MAFVSGAPEPSRTVAILLGASRWELHEALDDEKMRPAYEAAYRRVRSYLRSEQGLGLPERNLLDLFNSRDTSLEQDQHIRDFLRQQVSNEVATCTDILFYFIGHGSTNRDGRFVFILRSTERNRITQTAYAARDFADALKRETPTQRYWLLLDCCASAKAYVEFQPSRSVYDVLHGDVDQFLPVLPDSGAALFAACSSDAVALVNVTDGTTLFTAALMNVLERGDPALGEMLTLSEIAKLTQAEINSKVGPQSVRPEVSDPDERKGKISLTPFFPNAARGIPPIERQVTALTRAVEELSRVVLDRLVKVSDESQSKSDPPPDVKAATDDSQPVSAPTHIPGSPAPSAISGGTRAPDTNSPQILQQYAMIIDQAGALMPNIVQTRENTTLARSVSFFALFTQLILILVSIVYRDFTPITYLVYTIFFISTAFVILSVPLLFLIRRADVDSSSFAIREFEFAIRDLSSGAPLYWIHRFFNIFGRNDAIVGLANFKVFRSSATRSILLLTTAGLIGLIVVLILPRFTTLPNIFTQIRVVP